MLTRAEPPGRVTLARKVTDEETDYDRKPGPSGKNYILQEKKRSKHGELIWEKPKKMKRENTYIKLDANEEIKLERHISRGCGRKKGCGCGSIHLYCVVRE
jgi:hypothetical protein